MGGCRCTYKNCTLRTDGVTHMFHYPVFDKVRCHQWLTNAQKLEFLNLKVSQLKNRVVCQHHFKDDNFMNFLKDKLTFDAVPTEDGPYCDSSQLPEKKTVQDDSKLYSISLEDIENEYLTFNDKKANFSVKYGDFLTNCELMDLDSVNPTSNNTQIMTKDKTLQDNTDTIMNDNNVWKNVKKVHVILNNTLDTPQQKTDNIVTINVSEVPVEHEPMQAKILMPNINACTAPNISQENNIVVSGKGNNNSVSKEQLKKKNNKSLLKDKNITILDEQKICRPIAVPFPVKLEPICPSAVLSLPNKKRNLNLNSGNNYIIKPNYSTGLPPDVVEGTIVLEQSSNSSGNTKYNVPVENVSRTHENNISRIQNDKTEDACNSENNVSYINSTDIRHQRAKNRYEGKKNNNSLLKTKIPPERIAAIEEKRKFNMKLRDIIASCVDKLDDKEAKDCDDSISKSKREKNITQKVGTYLAKEPELPGINEYTVAYLEARMQRMENILLNKIAQNSQSIIELKQSLSPSPDKKTVHTQTLANEEQQKKHLYQEISKYLSPEANSLLYEELFINKYAQKIPPRSSKRKRK